eukprot:TRINITY_DN3311_c0_g1_i1.p1 TRINITY_DN3311_c0_g1~~TRINITY_DN3311_c0_g1_i1.p1  ORF type:complete len:742 (+),score=236.24 TRINITY_DN3311_c0_g1_i1:180-2405(+)
MLTLRHGNAEQRLRLGFALLDQNGNGTVSKDELERAAFAMFEALSGIESGGQLVFSTVSEFADKFFKEFDTNRDGRISFDEYRHGCLTHPSFVASLGACSDEEDLPRYASSNMETVVKRHPVTDIQVDADAAFFGEERFSWMLTVMAGLQLAIAETADVRHLSVTRRDASEHLGIRFEPGTLVVAGVTESGACAGAGGEWVVGRTLSHVDGIPVTDVPGVLAAMQGHLQHVLRFETAAAGTSAPAAAPAAAAAGVLYPPPPALPGAPAPAPPPAPAPAPATSPPMSGLYPAPPQGVSGLSGLQLDTGCSWVAVEAELTPSSPTGHSDPAALSASIAESRRAEHAELCADVKQKSWWRIGSEAGGFVISAYAPKACAALRAAFGVESRSILDSLGISHVLGSLLLGDLCSLTAHVSEGKSKQMFFASRDKKFFVKTISDQEGQSFLRMLPSMVGHVRANPCTTLAKVLGLYSIRTAKASAEKYFVTMATVFETEREITERYDLKGSTSGRTVGEQNRGTPGTVYKDLDFLAGDTGTGWSGPQKLRLRPGDAEALRRQLAADVGLLRRHGVVDYSLLVGVSPDPRIDVDAFRKAFLASHGEELRKVHGDLRRSLDSHAPQIMSAMDFDTFCATAFVHTPEAHPGARRFGARQQQQVEGDDSAPAVNFHRGVPTMRRDAGVCVYGEQRLYIGIIDYLVPFALRKQAEYGLKRVLAGGAEDFSVVPPERYADRFLAFMQCVIAAG